MNFPKIILASKSPRRSQLLREAGFDFEIKTNEVEENYPEEMPPAEVPVFLAQKKAMAAKKFIENNEVVLAADSIVIIGGTILEKPQNYEDAFRMIRMLSGNEHEVITGVCLLSKDKERSFAGSSKVFFHDLNDEEIDYYIKMYQPYDKAGSYGVQEWIGFCKIRRIEGTYTNVMGLPVDLVYQEMKHFIP